MDSSLHVRLFQDADGPALTDLLHRAYAELGNLGLNFTAIDQDEATTVSRARGGRCLIVEDTHGRLVGTLTISVPPSRSLQRLYSPAGAPGYAWLNQLAVSPVVRRAGVARHLWGLARQWCEERGITTVGIDTAIPATHLTGLYTRWGFRQVDTIHWPGKTYDSAVMLLTL